MTEVKSSRKCQECYKEMADNHYCDFCKKNVKSDLFISVSETIKIREAIKGKIRKGEKGEVKPHIEFSEKDLESGDSKLPDGVHMSMSADRENDRYRQVVTCKRTGKVLHQEDEPLSIHHSKQNKR